MKKGFTLVEAAVVIMLLGVIIAMVFKVRDISYNAKVKHEIVRIYSLKSAVSTAIRANPVLKSDNYMAIYDTVINNNFFKEADLFSHIILNNWNLDRAVKVVEKNIPVWSVLGKNNKVIATNIIIYHNVSQIPSRLVCELEKSIDDRSLNGDGGKGFLLKSGDKLFTELDGTVSQRWMQDNADPIYEECKSNRSMASGYGYTVYP